MERRVLLLLAVLPAVTGYMFPKDCFEDYKGEKVDCCPMYNGSRCGGAMNRGSCVPVTADNDLRVSDWRGNISATFFKSMCVCKANFAGPNCGECAWGYQGDDCKTSHMVIRRDFLSLSEIERKRVIQAFLYCSFSFDPTWVVLDEGNRFDVQTFVFRRASYIDVAKYSHVCASGPWISDGREWGFPSMAHNGPGFGPWHRVLLRYLEGSMQRCIGDPSFALPYSNDNWDSVLTDDYFCKNDASGRFRETCALSILRGFGSPSNYPATRLRLPLCYCERPEIVRQFGLNPDQPNKPNINDLNVCVNRSDYMGGMRCVENYHNAMHMTFSGDMASTMTATNDPPFWVFHCDMDRVSERMRVQRGFTSANYPRTAQNLGHNANDCCACFLACHRVSDMVQDTRMMGYRYS